MGGRAEGQAQGPPSAQRNLYLLNSINAVIAIQEIVKAFRKNMKAAQKNEQAEFSLRNTE